MPVWCIHPDRKCLDFECPCLCLECAEDHLTIRDRQRYGWHKWRRRWRKWRRGQVSA